jgi:hypothetical protein
MNQGFTSIAFKMDDGNGIKYISGIGKFSSAGIVIEFESKLFGIISNGVKEVRISINEILDVKFKKGVFKVGAKIEVRLNTFAKLSELPNKNGRLILKVVREDFEEAERAAAKLQKDVQNHQQNLPVTQTPVSRLFDESEDDTRKLTDD